VRKFVHLLNHLVPNSPHIGEVINLMAKQFAQRKNQNHLVFLLFRHILSSILQRAVSYSCESEADNKLVFDEADPMPWTKVTVDRSSYGFPNRCPDCLKYGPKEVLTIASDTEKLKGYYIVAIKYQQLRVGIPFCTECAAKRERNGRYGRLLFTVAFVVGVAIALRFDLGRWQTFALGIFFVAPAMWMMYYRNRQVRVSDYSDDTVTFSFKHPEYAEEFIELNSARVD